MHTKNQLKVLVVDDDDAIRFALVTTIRAEGYSVVEANNGTQAVEIFAKESPDIVLLDTVMPGMNGYEVCHVMREKMPDIYDLPILMITIMDDQQSIQKAQAAGASDYLIKPIQWPLLMYRLHILFKQKMMLAERNKLGTKLCQTYKLNAIRQLTGGFAHDFNNILTSQLGYTELALDHCAKYGDAKIQTYLEEVQKASLRGKILIEHLMTYAMDSMDLTSATEVKTSFSDSIKTLIKNIPPRITFDATCDVDNEWIGIDFIQFHQILMNLVENSIDAIVDTGTISVKLSKEHLDRSVCASCLHEFEGDYITLCVKDTGSGIDEKITQRIFEPFYTTKPVGNGTGHGMSVIHGIVHAASGHIRVYTTPDNGCTITIYLLPITVPQQPAV